MSFLHYVNGLLWFVNAVLWIWYAHAPVIGVCSAIACAGSILMARTVDDWRG